MVTQPQDLISDFALAASSLGREAVVPSLIFHELLLAPHDPPDLPAGKCAVYVFSLSQNVQALAGAHRVLKVGRVGPNSGPRFKYQHYKPGSANSTLAGALENNRLLWSYLGIQQGVSDFGSWLQRNTDRDHFFLDGRRTDLVSLLEVYPKAVLGPVFEGNLKEVSAKPQ